MEWPNSGESLEDIAEMRPEPLPFDSWYDEPDLRGNDDRAYLGLDDWQTDYPIEDDVSELTEWLDFDPDC